MSDYEYKLGFIGAGNMAEAIARGAIRAKAIKPREIAVADPSEDRQKALSRLGIRALFDDAREVVARCEQVLLAVKPQVFPKLADALVALDRERQVVISIMAGVTIERIEAAVGGPARVIRVMPNTPAMVGYGMAGIAVGDHAQYNDEALTVQVFRGCGEVAKVDEDGLDAVTAVSGSGPAYVFLFAEAMMKTAADLGLLGCHRLFVEQTLKGAIELWLESGESPAELRHKVTSPGGTTQAAIEHFQSQGFEQLVRDAMTAARDRSVELGRGE